MYYELCLNYDEIDTHNGDCRARFAGCRLLKANALKVFFVEGAEVFQP